MIKTGRDSITLMPYIAILAVCFVINLPGIVITPMEGKLKELLHASELEVQLLTVLPNFVIIPFVLLTGKLSLCRHKLPWIIGALCLYLGCGIAYLFVETIPGLIVVSCLLGCANGILIPFSMGFVVNTFYGKFRTRQLGIKSATSNLSVVIGSFVVGALMKGDNWHLPFVVYLAVLLPIVFCFWLKYVPGVGARSPISREEVKSTSVSPGKTFDVKGIWALIGNNVSFSFITMAIVIFIPQMIQTLGWKPELAGEIVSVFFIAVLLAGFVLLPFVKLMKQYTFFGISLLTLAGLALITFLHEEWAMFAGSICGGIAFGFFQPFIYDKTSYTVRDGSKTIIALSFVLAALYTAIALEPFVISAICHIFKIKSENIFVFRLSFFMAIAYSAATLLWRRKFAFSVEKAYLSEPDKPIEM